MKFKIVKSVLVNKVAVMCFALALPFLATAQSRSQDPVPPLPYSELDVTYRNFSVKGVTLAGSLCIPQGKGPFPAVVLISGSGQQNRDEELFGHRPFRVIADYLARIGIASLRYDDRGFAKSIGSLNKITTLDFASDVEAGVSFLKSRSEIDGRKIGLVGHSEGGIIAPIVASRQANGIAFVVMLAGTAFPGDEILLAQTEAIMKSTGSAFSSNQKNHLDLLRSLLPIIKAANMTEGSDELARRLIPVAKPFLKFQTNGQIEVETRKLTSHWMRFFLRYDPCESLAAVRVPILALNGSKDVQVLSNPNILKMKNLAGAKHLELTAVEMPNLNHFFQTCKTGSLEEYAKIEETFSPEALKILRDWILQKIQ